MEKELQKSKVSQKKVEKQSSLYDDVISKRPAKTDSNVLRTLSVRLEKIATDLKVSVGELLEKAEHDSTFKEEYLEARQVACQIALLRK